MGDSQQALEVWDFLQEKCSLGVNGDCRVGGGSVIVERNDEGSKTVGDSLLGERGLRTGLSGCRS